MTSLFESYGLISNKTVLKSFSIKHKILPEPSVFNPTNNFYIKLYVIKMLFKLKMEI